jgi:hypothetical protein
MVLQANRARVGAAEAVNGTTLFAGDELYADAGGSLRVRVKSSIVYLPADSSAQIEDWNGAAGISLARGGLDFTLSTTDLVGLRVGDLELRSTASSSHGQVRRLNENELMISCLSGELLAVVGDESLKIPAGQTAHLLVQSGQQVPAPAGTAKGKVEEKRTTQEKTGGNNPNPQGAGSDRSRRMKILGWWVGGAIAGGIIAAVIWYNTREPASP